MNCMGLEMVKPKVIMERDVLTHAMRLRSAAIRVRSMARTLTSLSSGVLMGRLLRHALRGAGPAQRRWTRVTMRVTGPRIRKYGTMAHATATTSISAMWNSLRTNSW